MDDIRVAYSDVPDESQLIQNTRATIEAALDHVLVNRNFRAQTLK